MNSNHDFLCRFSFGSEDEFLNETAGGELQRLPGPQMEAWNQMIKEVKWMISDEIAFALTTHAAQITEFTLKTVAEHVANSHGKPGNSLTTIPLHYVYGHQSSHKLFLAQFNEFSVPGWEKVTLGSYAYFVLENHETQEYDENETLVFSACSELVTKGSLASVLNPHDDEVFLLSHDPDNLKNRQCRPQFWLILEITEERAALYFQYREGQFEATLPWRQTQQMIVNEVKSLCNKVNQGLLLNDLYETKLCNRLLEPETCNEEIWSSKKDQKRSENEGGENSSDSEDEEPQSDEEVTYLEANLNMRYKPGTFTCPLMWSIDLPLHLRLRESATSNISAGSRGLHVTRMVLNSFSVPNRKNMFAYRDDRKNIFYFKIQEYITTRREPPSFRDFDIPASEVLSRTSSISSQVSIIFKKIPKKLCSRKFYSPEKISKKKVRIFFFDFP